MLFVSNYINKIKTSIAVIFILFVASLVFMMYGIPTLIIDKESKEGIAFTAVGSIMLIIFMIYVFRYFIF